MSSVDCLILQEIIREAEDNVHFLFMVDVRYEIKRLNFPIFFFIFCLIAI